MYKLPTFELLVLGISSQFIFLLNFPPERAYGAGEPSVEVFLHGVPLDGRRRAHNGAKVALSQDRFGDAVLISHVSKEEVGDHDVAADVAFHVHRAPVVLVLLGVNSIEY